MLKNCMFVVSGLAVMLLAGRADAATIGSIKLPSNDNAMLQQVHSVGEAEETLYRRGYYDVRVERLSLPYSFNACKRGVRYHIHVNYYGDLVQVDEVGSCRGSYDEGAYYGRRPYYDRYRRRDY